MTPRFKYLTSTQAAERLDVSRQTIRRWLAEGRLHGHRTAGGGVRGGHWRIDPRDVEAMLQDEGKAQ